MEAGTLIVIVAVGLTSLAGGALARAWRTDGGWPAGARAWIPIEAIGLGMQFFAANLLVAGLEIAIGRRISTEYLAVYVLDDVTLLAVSLLQGVWFRLGCLRAP
jgi:hypothetical protein